MDVFSRRMPLLLCPERTPNLCTSVLYQPARCVHCDCYPSFCTWVHTFIAPYGTHFHSTVRSRIDFCKGIGKAMNGGVIPIAIQKMEWRCNKARFVTRRTVRSCCYVNFVGYSAQSRLILCDRKLISRYVTFSVGFKRFAVIVVLLLSFLLLLLAVVVVGGGCPSESFSLSVMKLCSSSLLYILVYIYILVL